MTDAPHRTRGISLGRAFGGRIVVQPATLVMLVLLALLFSTRGGNELDRRSFVEGVVLALLLFASVLVHELAHAATAKGLGRTVHEVVLTLWGGHTSFDGRGMTPLVSGLTAIAGPIANVVLAALGGLVLASGTLDASVTDAASGSITGQGIVGYLVYINVLLAAFNSLPGIPMDGGRALEAIVWRITGNRYRGLIVAAWAGRIIAVGAVLFVVGAPLARGATPDLVMLMVGALLFMVLWPAASTALRTARTLDRRQGLTVGALMVPATAVKFDVTVAQALEFAQHANAREVVVVAADDTPAGHFPVALIDEVPVAQHASTGLQSVTMPLARGAVVDAGLTGDALVAQLQQWWGQTDVWVVSEAGTVVGVVQLTDVMQALQ